MAEMMISGWGGFPLIGTKEQIVDGLATLSKIGLDGVLLSGRATSKACANSAT